MAKISTIDVKDITKTITANISITGYGKWKVKLYIGSLFIRFGIWIIGMKSNIKTEK